MAEAYRLRLSPVELQRAIFGLTPRERHDAANFFIGAIRKSEEVFDRFPGKVSDSTAELWVPDLGTEDRHHISLVSKNKVEVRYESVSRTGRVLRELVDQRAVDVIAQILSNVGVLIPVDD